MRPWLEARAANDSARLATAGRMIAGIPSWSFYGPPFADQSYRDVINRVVAAVNRDDPTPVATNVALNCTGIRR